MKGKNTEPDNFYNCCVVTCLFCMHGAKKKVCILMWVNWEIWCCTSKVSWLTYNSYLCFHFHFSVRQYHTWVTDRIVNQMNGWWTNHKWDENYHLSTYVMFSLLFYAEYDNNNWKAHTAADWRKVFIEVIDLFANILYEPNYRA